MPEQPLVSVIIPTFNREKILSGALDSVIKQTYTNFELIIVDDKSTDATKELVAGYQKKDTRIKYYQNTHQKGPGGARNTGILNSKGKYIAFLDSDDEWIDCHLARSIEVLETEKVNSCFSLWWERTSGELHKFDLEETPVKKAELEKAIRALKARISGNVLFFDQGIFEYIFLSRFFCYHICTMVFNRKIVDRIGLFDERLALAEDTDFIFRVLHEDGFCLIKEYHYIYNEGMDNLYKFIDRTTIDLPTIMANPEIVDKLTHQGKYQNEMWKKTKKLIKASITISQKHKCIQRLNWIIASKYFTLGILNEKLRKKRACYYLLKAMIYHFEASQLYYLSRVVFPMFFHGNRNQPELNF
jgi:glycosyltransferase involved in cell wall biosynthesis